MMLLLLRSATALALLAGTGLADMEKVKAESNPERRSDLALAHADEELTVARKAYDDGEIATFSNSLKEVAELAQLSLESLDSTGKRARRNPRFWKRAEQKLMLLLRRLDGLEKSVSIDDRALVGTVRKTVSETHEAILNAIMTKK